MDVGLLGKYKSVDSSYRLESILFLLWSSDLRLNFESRLDYSLRPIRFSLVLPSPDWLSLLQGLPNKGSLLHCILHRWHLADLIPYCVQSVFILLGPILFAPSVYMALGRLIRSTGGEKYSLIRIEWLPKIFVANDMISFLVPGTGSGNDGHGRVWQAQPRELRLLD
ncbi:uncharacterized protein N7469_000020 [Penicillium citrinum]|uniref:Uncharacterized protein n=1 Tax=Penicillium citrinum TaxID=5077 RepID=A0A9W9PF06_PENCI|nr:uncharacterized protein N7469_000020 [Penicillium citrinum]KAJ5241693.1 hypothetical protein N7469_000020 [Penicillium citrinum]